MKMNEAAVAFVRSFGLQPFEVEQVLQPYQIPVDILLGLVKTESGGNAEAMRFEKGYPWLFHVPHFAKMFAWTADTETALQRFSYGLCQIMLATARERGFLLHPMKLLEPKIGLAWGAYHLHLLYQRYNTWPATLSAYNQGSPKKAFLSKTKFKNQKYVDTVLLHAREFRDVL